jgi:hypothetical protein
MVLAVAILQRLHLPCNGSQVLAQAQLAGTGLCKNLPSAPSLLQIVT